MTIQDLIDQWRLHPSPEVGSCANQLAGWLRTQEVGMKETCWCDRLRSAGAQIGTLCEPCLVRKVAAQAATIAEYGRSITALDTSLSERNLTVAEQTATIAQLQQQRDQYKTLAGIGVWHADCRPNREMAARELAKSQAIIDKLADRITELESASAASRGGGDTRPPRQDEKAIDR